MIMKKFLRMMMTAVLAVVCNVALAQDYIWTEDWSTASANQTPTDVNSNYSFTNGGGTTMIYDENLAGGTAPELLIAKSNGSFTANIDLKGKSGEFTLRFQTNKTIEVSSNTTGVTISELTKNGNSRECTVTVPPSTPNLQLTFTSTTKSNARFDDVKLFQGTAKKPAGLSWGTASRYVTIGADDNVFPTLTNDNNLAVTYTCGPAEVATIDKDGNITLVGEGNATVSAIFEGNAEYEAQTVSYTLQVKAAPTVDISNTPETAYTVAKALELIDANEGLDTKVYVKGIVTDVSEISVNFGNATYTISDDAAKTYELLVYRGSYLNGEKFTAEDQLKVGDNVVVYGKLTDYNGTKEFTTGSSIYSLNGTTGINTITTNDATDGVTYNLAGQRVAESYKGAVIRNGKKFIQR
ncbi:MAG: hypothetical protein SO064_01405 [Prevotella sp.]|nr:hypothetical protein [Prevotella sp.]